MEKIDTIVKQLFKEFEGNSLFDKYFIGLDIEQDGPYMVFGAFGELFNDLLKGNIKDEGLRLHQCDFINQVLVINDPEIENVIKSEVFSVLDRKEIKLLKTLLTEDAYSMLNSLYKH